MRCLGSLPILSLRGSNALFLVVGAVLAACGDGEDTTQSRPDRSFIFPDAGVLDGSIAGEDGGTGLCKQEFLFPDWDVKTDRRMVKACSPYVIDGTIDVSSDATLTIEPGVEIRLQPGERVRTALFSPGRIIAQGTEAEPIVFTTVTQDSPTAGSWLGVDLGRDTLSGTIFEHVEIRYAGEGSGACMKIGGGQNRVSVQNTRFFECAGRAVSATDPTFGFQIFENNTLENSPIGLELAPDGVGSIPATQTFINVPENRVFADTIGTRYLRNSATWPKHGIPWVVDGELDIEGGNNPVLTLEAGVELLFGPAATLTVGFFDPGGLVLEGTSGEPVILGSSAGSPTPGAWVGVLFGTDTLPGTRFTNAIIRHGGGQGGFAAGCVTLSSTPPNAVTIESTTFDSCDRAGVVSTTPDRPFASFSGNSFENGEVGMHIISSNLGSVSGAQTYSNVDKNILGAGDVPESATWAAQPIPWEVSGNIVVGASGSQPVLTVEAGSIFRFPAATTFSVGSFSTNGGLIAQGSSNAPIVFESVQPSAGQGSWGGLRVASTVVPGTVFDHVVLRHGGEGGLGNYGCMILDSAGLGRVSVQNSTFELCNGAAIVVPDGNFAFGTFSGNTFIDSDAGMIIDAQAIGSITEAQTYTNTPHNIIEASAFSPILENATWVDQGVPWLVNDDLVVEGPLAPFLTIQAGSVLRFSQSNRFRVGRDNPGGILLLGTSTDPIILESRAPVAASAAWQGVVLQDEVLTGTTLDHVIIRHAGEPPGETIPGAGGVVLMDTFSRVTISNSTFSDNAVSDVHVDCDSTPTLVNNTYVLGVVNEAGCP